MTTRRIPFSTTVIAAVILHQAFPSAAQQGTAEAVRIDSDDLGGVVTGARGPEAGVWVIAETNSLPTKFSKTVVTDDRGRYLVPDLPKAEYEVWVRGYGLVDSPKVKAAPGKILNLTAVAAPDSRAAAEYYPAGYWFSLIQPPAKSEFPGTGPTGNGISPNIKTQAEWLRLLKSGGCTACHQLGNKATREIPKNLGAFDSAALAWERRVQSGQAGGNMVGGLGQLGKERALAVLGDWSNRIAAGETPPAPPRPQGVERNVVITQWDWADPKSYLHDEVSTDRRNPALNPNGLIYGSLELSADYLPVLDPVRHTLSKVPLTVRDPKTPPTSPAMLKPSPYWGDEVIWTSKNNVHNPMFDEKGRVWITSAVRPSANPDFCKEGSSHPSAKLFPLNSAGRHLQVYDPKTKELTHINTCFGTHHLMFAEDANNTLWTSGGGQVVGWLNTKLFDETKDQVRSQGWTALIMDTNGNGKRDAYVEPDQPVDPTRTNARRRTIRSRRPGQVSVGPVLDLAQWSGWFREPTRRNCAGGVYEPPTTRNSVRILACGADVDRNGVVGRPSRAGYGQLLTAAGKGR
jgi:hypothetical protein